MAAGTGYKGMIDIESLFSSNIFSLLSTPSRSTSSPAPSVAATTPDVRNHRPTVRKRHFEGTLPHLITNPLSSYVLLYFRFIAFCSGLKRFEGENTILYRKTLFHMQPMVIDDENEKRA